MAHLAGWLVCHCNCRGATPAGLGKPAALRGRPLTAALPRARPVCPQVSQHERCEIRVTVEGPGGPEAATILNSVMVDSSESGGRLEMGNVGQWDMMAG